MRLLPGKGARHGGDFYFVPGLHLFISLFPSTGHNSSELWGAGVRLGKDGSAEIGAALNLQQGPDENPNTSQMQQSSNSLPVTALPVLHHFKHELIKLKGQVCISCPLSSKMYKTFGIS